MMHAHNVTDLSLDELAALGLAEKNQMAARELLQEILQRLAAQQDRQEVPSLRSAQSAMETSTFDIFSGAPGRNAVWLESATGIERARARTQEK
jgi:hypothetical protein